MYSSTMYSAYGSACAASIMRLSWVSSCAMPAARLPPPLDGLTNTGNPMECLTTDSVCVTDTCGSIITHRGVSRCSLRARFLKVGLCMPIAEASTPEPV
ncbi:hypothetical protein SGRIM128S_07855 [Streptomyces griseomycini]